MLHKTFSDVLTIFGMQARLLIKGAFISSIENIIGEVEVINFDVEPLDVYFAGGVLVHNKGASSEP